MEPSQILLIYQTVFHHEGRRRITTVGVAGLDRRWIRQCVEVKTIHITAITQSVSLYDINETFIYFCQHKLQLELFFYKNEK